MLPEPAEPEPNRLCLQRGDAEGAEEAQRKQNKIDETGRGAREGALRALRDSASFGTNSTT